MTWFVAAAETGGPPIALLEASQETAGGRLEGGTVRVPAPMPPDLPPCAPEEEGGFGCFEIEIKVIATPNPAPPPDPPLAERNASAAGPNFPIQVKVPKAEAPEVPLAEAGAFG